MRKVVAMQASAFEVGSSNVLADGV